MYDHHDDVITHMQLHHVIQQQSLRIALPLWQWIVIHALADQHDTTPDMVVSVLITNAMNTASDHDADTAEPDTP